jgi:hypothetical protein
VHQGIYVVYINVVCYWYIFTKGNRYGWTREVETEALHTKLPLFQSIKNIKNLLKMYDFRVCPLYLSMG